MIDEKKLIEEMAKEKYTLFESDSHCGCTDYKSIDAVDYESIMEVIGKQPKIGEWIPCSERLPEPGHRYLVSVVWEDEGAKTYSVYDAVYGSDAKWHSHNYECMIYCKIVAWQPLPEPYIETVGRQKHE
ncbi:MAG: DUF551 domain-containing protein [Lachnospiraceae bacterium]|nr:DUF551 domain-containing protein [Lachnospiraceae bacterium]